ncbi:MAG TPA: hypothetical protein VEL70_09085 [Candidatus Acidoferrum sp.]|nr:hypothetical protein [Candidatus Acidoferrum sp.]
MSACAIKEQLLLVIVVIALTHMLEVIEANTAPLDYHSIRTPGNYDVNYWSVYRIFVNSGFYQTET